jgi:hypothetical protein
MRLQEAAEVVAAERRTPAVAMSAVVAISAVARILAAEPISAAFAPAAGRISAAHLTSVAEPVSAAHLTLAADPRYHGLRGGQVSALNARSPFTAAQIVRSAAGLRRTQTEAPR